MTPERFVAKLKKLGYSPHNAHKLLGIARSSVYRYVNGSAPVPPVVEKLLYMFEHHGVPSAMRINSVG